MNYTNHLSDETSPYLLQHASNPVDWYPWGEKAIEKARREKKPILLSIGYSACHWCHVMAHESFEDPATAAVMNELFINIKVDREERPDIDKIYQTAHSLLTRRTGGWPLTMFLTPDEHIPFFGGTYFPDKQRHGMPGFSDLCKHVISFYQEQSPELERQNRSLLEFMMNNNEGDENNEHSLDETPLTAARQQLEQHFDSQDGGFGKAPKFPHPTSIERLLRHWSASKAVCADKRGLHMALFTLDRMALGGIYDQIGGGFCRYSVDDEWMIPHFEKMLYDNGPLLSLYAQAYAITGNKLYQRNCQLTVEWLRREMLSPEGSFYSSLDADSEGKEGTFYIWSNTQVEQLLNTMEYTVISKRFGFDKPENFEGKWHLHTYSSIEKIAKESRLSTTDVTQHLSTAGSKLFTERETRIRPGRDEKILVSWNALMIKGLAEASRYLETTEYIDLAEQAIDAILKTQWKDGRLLATSKEGRAHLNAYLDDYVFLVDAIIEVLQARWNTQYLEFSIALIEVVLTHFNATEGGFYFTSDDHEVLIQRPKPFSDDALPAGNAIAAKVLNRLGYLLGNTRYLDAAEKTLRAAWPHMLNSPYAHTGLLLALEEYLHPVQSVIIRGDLSSGKNWHQDAAKHYQPARMVFFIPTGQSNLPKAIASKPAKKSTVAYVCEGLKCLPPLFDKKSLIDKLTG